MCNLRICNKQVEQVLLWVDMWIYLISYLIHFPVKLCTQRLSQQLSGHQINIGWAENCVHYLSVQNKILFLKKSFDYFIKSSRVYVFRPTLKFSCYKEYMADSLPNLFAGLPPDQKEHVKVYLQRNYARAEVYFQTLNVIKIQESPLYDVRLFSLYILHQI